MDILATNPVGPEPIFFNKLFNDRGLEAGPCTIVHISCKGISTIQIKATSSTIICTTQQQQAVNNNIIIMKLKLPRKNKLFKKGVSSPGRPTTKTTPETIATESCSQSNNLSDPLSPLSTTSSRRRNSNNNVTSATVELDSGIPSSSTLTDLHRVLKLIESERHLAAHRLYTHARDRIIIGNTTTSCDDTSSLASARTLLNVKHHEFSTLEKRCDIFSNAKINLSATTTTTTTATTTTEEQQDEESSSWILAQTLFGITTHYRREPIDNSLSIKIEGELSDVDTPLFEQIVVLRECDLYHTWAPFMTKSRKLAQLDKLDVVAWYEVGVPLLGLMRDACYRAVGCDCMKEDGSVLLVAVGLNDSEEHGVKNALPNINSSHGNNNNNNNHGGATTGGEEEGKDEVGNNDAVATAAPAAPGGGEQQRRRRSYVEQQLASATTDSNLVTDTVASSFLARDEILETIEIPPIPTGTGKGRMTIRNFAASIDVLGPSSARTCIVVNVDPNLHFLPQSLIDFTMKKMAGVMILKLQHAAKRVVADPIKNPHARRMREDVTFYRDWLLPRFQRHCVDLGWEMPPVKALEVSDEELRAEGVFESWRSEVDSTSNHNHNTTVEVSSTIPSEEDDETNNTTIGSPASVVSSNSSKGSKSKLAKFVKQLRSPETPEEKIASARLRAAKRLKPEPFSDSKKRRLRELKGAKRKAEDRNRANDESSCDEGSVTTFGTFQTIHRWDEQSGLKKSLVVFTITFLLNVVLPYCSSDKFLSSLSLSFKQQILSMARESVVPLFFIFLQATSLRALLEFLLIFAFDSIDFGQKRLVQNMDFGRKLYHAEVRKYSSITANAVVAVSCGLAFFRFVFEEVAISMCSYFDGKDWSIICDDDAASKESWSCSHLGLTISTFITIRLGIFVLAVLLMASIVLPKPERRVVRNQKSNRTTTPRSTSSSRASNQIDAEDTASGSAVSLSTPRDIPHTIGGGNNPLSIYGTFSPVGSMSMDVIDEEDEG